ncbi:MAG: hypothetical protein ACLSG9_05795 [Eubacterium sp.]
MGKRKNDIRWTEKAAGVWETAKSVLKYGGEDSRLAESRCCKQLQILTLLYLPKEDENIF